MNGDGRRPSSPMRADSLENILTILAATHGRYVQIHKGKWGFSQGSGYHPERPFDTLTEALAHEVERLEQEANRKFGLAADLTTQGQRLQADVDLIERLATGEKGSSSTPGEGR